MFVLHVMPRAVFCFCFCNWKSTAAPSSWKWKSPGYIFALFGLFHSKHESSIQMNKYLLRYMPCFFRTDNGDYSHEIKICLLLGRKAMTNLDSIFKSRDINLPRKVHLVQAMVFLVVKGCGWTMQRRWDFWPPEEKNSIQGQRWGLIAQSFCVVKFY